MSAANAVTLIMIALVIGIAAGSICQTCTGHYRHMEAMTGRYLAEKNWLDARAAEMMADLKKEATQVKSDLERSSKEVRRGKKTD